MPISNPGLLFGGMPPLEAGDGPLDDIVTQTVGRALDLFGIDTRTVKRWKDEPAS